ncbi:MAG: hypothetical protein PHU25_15360 [Deltaproteobacteria bacterium]|nr:hypothetical protein [Deltaproteobacteria bacterium]
MAKVPFDTSESIDWGAASKRLTLFVQRRLGCRGSIDDAQEIAQEAIRRFLDPNYADWDTTKQPDLFLYLGSIANGVIRNRIRHSSTTTEEVTDMTPREMQVGISAPDLSPEHRAASAERARRAIDVLLERLDGDDLGQKILFLVLDGVDAAPEQAARLKVPIGAVYKARHRLNQHRQAVERLLDTEVANAQDAAL